MEMSEEEKEAIKLLKQEPDFSLSYYKRERAIDVALNYIDRLQKENKELKRCIDAQKIMRKDMPKDTKLILMYSEDYKRIFKEE